MHERDAFGSDGFDMTEGRNDREGVQPSADLGTCPDTDAIVTIATALDWEIEAGLEHLQRCAECNTRIGVLQATRVALAQAESVDPALEARIGQALRARAKLESAETPQSTGTGRRSARAARVISVAEAVLAGAVAPALLILSDIPLASPTVALVTFVLASGLLLLGQRVRPGWV